MAREDYEELQEARRERYEGAAAKQSDEATARFNSHNIQAVRGMAGEPIHVGHHSEGRHRSLLRKADNDMRKGCEANEKAKHYAYKAQGVGSGGISQDDPEAVNKLNQELGQCEKMQERMKAANKAIHKKGDSIPALVALDFSADHAHKLLEKDCMGDIGFPRYALTNNGANIRRLKKRIEALKQEAAREPHTPISSPWFEVYENEEDNRIWFDFESRPCREVCQIMRQGGWRWSKQRGVWLRMLNAFGWYRAREMALALCLRGGTT